MATHSSILAWRISWTEEPVRLQSMGLQRVRHDWVSKHSNILYIYNKYNKHLCNEKSITDRICFILFLAFLYPFVLVCLWYNTNSRIFLYFFLVFDRICVSVGMFGPSPLIWRPCAFSLYFLPYLFLLFYFSPFPSFRPPF